MRRLEYHLMVQSDGVVHATFDDGERQPRTRIGSLNLADLEMITQDYLPILEAGRQQPRDRLERLGTLLYRLLFPAPIAGHFEELAWRRVQEGQGACLLALSLTLQEGLPAKVLALPWEFLYCPRGQTFLATDPCVAFFRRPPGEVTAAYSTLGQDSALRVLLVRLQAPDAAPVALTRIKNVLNELAERSQRLLPPLVLENPTPLELERELADYRPHVLHLVLHGRFEDRGTYFALADGAGQAMRWYRDRSLSDLFQAYRPYLVLLQACEGGRLSDLSGLAQGAQRLVQRQIAAVLAMHYPITNQTGWAFAEELYRQLVGGEKPDVAVQRGRRVLALGNDQAVDDHASRDFAAPILWMCPERSNTMIELRIAVPDGADFAAKAPPQTPIGQILDDLLSQWQPPPDVPQGSFRYSLRTSFEGAGEYSPTLTLQQMGEPLPRFELVLQELDLDSPVGLIVENARGERYSTAVLLKTRVGRLADAFLDQQAQAGEVVVELVAGEPNINAARRLDLNASLYEEGIDDHAVLRIHCHQEQPQE